MDWKSLTELPEEPGFYWYSSPTLGEPMLVQVAMIHEPEVRCRKSGMLFEAFNYMTVRLCTAMKVWPDRVIRYPSLWLGPLIPPSVASPKTELSPTAS